MYCIHFEDSLSPWRAYTTATTSGSIIRVTGAALAHCAKHGDGAALDGDTAPMPPVFEKNNAAFYIGRGYEVRGQVG